MSCCSVASFLGYLFPASMKKQQTVPKENSPYRTLYVLKMALFDLCPAPRILPGGDPVLFHRNKAVHDLRPGDLVLRDLRRFAAKLSNGFCSFHSLFLAPRSFHGYEAASLTGIRNTQFRQNGQPCYRSGCHKIKPLPVFRRQFLRSGMDTANTG